MTRLALEFEDIIRELMTRRGFSREQAERIAAQYIACREGDRLLRGRSA